MIREAASFAPPNVNSSFRPNLAFVRAVRHRCSIPHSWHPRFALARLQPIDCLTNLGADIGLVKGRRDQLIERTMLDVK